VFGEGYSAVWPAVKARHEYVAAFMEERGLIGRTLLDIGAGEGHFLRKMRDRGWEVSGLDPSPAHCANLRMSGIPAYCGTAGHVEIEETFDVVTVLWTLENTTQPRKMLEFARSLLNPGGKIVVATGSRILVPFRKSLKSYLGDQKPDCHPTHWSATTLAAMLMRVGFAFPERNRFEDTDWLVCVAETIGPTEPLRGDDPDQVKAHFAKWHECFP